MPKPFHLAWFTNFTAGSWNTTFSHGGSPWDGKFHVEFALALERACFDYIILEDTLMVSEAYRGTAEATLKYGLQVPKHDPIPLAAMIAAATSRLGVVATMSTMAWPPFMLARVSTTLDHIAGGRFGWNIVTSGEDTAAQNFGLDKLPPRELRYAMADEYMELVKRLFDSWEPDAVVMDRERGIYADGARFTRSISRANSSSAAARSTLCRHLSGVRPSSRPAGRRVAAPLPPNTPNSIIAPAYQLAGMKEYRDDVRAHAVKFGRDPDDIKVSVFGLSDPRGDQHGSERKASAHGHCAGLCRCLAGRRSAPHPTSISRNSISTNRCPVD